MAESAVTLLIDVLRPIIENEVRLLRGVHDEVKDIMDEMESMVSCLREADRREDDNEGVKTWLKQLRDAAYDTEDVVEEYLLHLASLLEGKGRLVKFIHRNFQCALHLRKRHQIAIEMRGIKSRVQKIAAMRERYTIVNMKRIILLSYTDLPYNLKSCFLYLSLFPEDYNIKFMKLIRLWMAEGFVKSNQQNIMVEEVAKEYINVLIKRGLILIADRNSYGKVISCRVHDVVREIILSKAREENFTTFTDGVHMFRLLKVIDLDGMPLKVFPPEITELLHLRYLSLRDTSISELPKSIKRLCNLETLDLKGTMVRELPVEILKLRKLRHLLVYRYDDFQLNLPFDSVKGVRMPIGIGKMLELQKLSYLDGRPGQVKELRKLTQLKRLGIIKLRTEDGRDLCDAIQNMESLLSFDVTSRHENELLDLCLSQPPKLLQRVYLKGMLESLPSWITMLQNLVKLYLRWSKLKDDPFESLQNLPNLAELELSRAYDGNELRCGEGGFKKLQVLHIHYLNELKMVEIGEGAMCGLQKLWIMECLQLEKVPLGIEHIAHLKELNLVFMSEELCSRVRKDGGEDRPRIEHIKIISAIYIHDGQVSFRIL
ncbi:Disease resistance protein RPM1 [Acorus gramineus]|uniref:Disease resistance protein RPM1 n=1 Tax=Acorus gramineus TaxID=55184 RepID=A0AAV9AWZ6_ACOGR|nr:Disease resistance protein RPM1 [Acorus gramineus]